MEQIPCPDGYLLDANSPLAEGHHTLNQYLLRVEEAGWQQAMKEINSIRDKGRKLVAWKALIERMAWLRSYNSASACLSSLRGLAERIEKWTLAPGEKDLILILDRTADVAGFLAPYTPIPHIMNYVEAHGLTPQLSAAIRDFRNRVWDNALAVNQVSLQMFRSRLDMLAWQDEWTAIDLKRCWSERIREDFRSLKNPQRENWRRLLHSIHGDEGVRPAPRWLNQNRVVIEAIGQEEFRSRLMHWLEPLQAGSTHRLSREGSYILRCLIWLAESMNDPELTSRVERISEVEFKPKSNGQKVIRAAAEAAGKPNPIATPASPAPSLDALIARALTTVLSPKSGMYSAVISDRVQVRGEIVYVRGDLDSYQVHISTGAIFRASDSKRVHIASTARQPLPAGFPDFAGTTELFSDILILAEDARHAAALSSSSE